MSEAGREIPFSNGTEYTNWTLYNCERCHKDRLCPISVALAEGSLTDGTVPREMAERAGLPVDYDRAPVNFRCKEWEPQRPEPEPREPGEDVRLRAMGAACLPGFEVAR